ncbi:metallophosphoesterase [Litoribacter ruber]|uniref:metallophosphoesterase n=1 Tax=Litoribacter ruber TaxID=702568 RepID=UPI001BDAE0D5|nr:metallophosphoesterase [Litoribacter ruber]MBT0810733.1 metallophosphoesterase [Litoribacter ruber]
MRVQYLSDLHLEFPENREHLKQNPIKPLAEYLIIAGDLVPFRIMDRHTDFFDYLSDNFEQVYWLPGNHEYYHNDLSHRSGQLHEQIRSNIHLINNRVIGKGNVKLIFSTMWSAIKPQNAFFLQQGLMDFQTIKLNGKPFSVEDFNQLHINSLNFIKKEIPDGFKEKIIVVTHHVPTFIHYPEKYKTNILNEGFATELFPWIQTHGPNYWIYGHHHTNTEDFLIGDTLMLTNQLGYVAKGEHKCFQSGKVLEL